MAGKPKKRSRILGGTVEIDGIALAWELASEPGWSPDGFRGARVQISLIRAAGRPLIVQFPYDSKAGDSQRPRIPVVTVEAVTREAMADGWDPESRGRPYHFATTAELEAG